MHTESLSVQPEWKMQVERSRFTWEDNIKRVVEKAGYNGTYLGQVDFTGRLL
jgi:hypothetical protein